MDTYQGFAERYDWMKQESPARRVFYRQLFAEHGVAKVLDCACGTGQDLIMFHLLGLKVFGSDLSDAMLSQTRKNLRQAEISLPIQKADYRELPSHWDTQFGAVVCLANSINEQLEDAEALRAIRSMKSVLLPRGILVFSQAQTDAYMQNPPVFEPIVNDRDFTRLYTMAYAGNIQTVNIFDFVHTAEASDFQYWSVRLRIRLQDSWNEILQAVGFSEVRFYGEWDATPYSKESSRGLIGVAEN